MLRSHFKNISFPCEFFQENMQNIVGILIYVRSGVSKLAKLVLYLSLKLASLIYIETSGDSGVI